MGKRLYLSVLVLAFGLAAAALQTNGSASNTNQTQGQSKPSSQPNTPAASGVQESSGASSQTPSPSTSNPPASNPLNSTGGVAGAATAPQTTVLGNTTGGIGSNASNAAGIRSAADATTEIQTNAGAAATASSDMQAQIQNALKNEPTLGNDNLNVAVSEDEIDVSGAVATAKEKQTVKRIVQSYAGNRKVKDHLVVSSHGESNNPGMNPAGNPDQNKNHPPSGSQPPR